MTLVLLDEEPVLEDDDDGLDHIVCQDCYPNEEIESKAYCGTIIGPGPFISWDVEVKPMDLCVVCDMIERCPKCKKR